MSKFDDVASEEKYFSGEISVFFWVPKFLEQVPCNFSHF